MRVSTFVKYAFGFFAIVAVISAFPTAPRSDGYRVTDVVNNINDKVVKLQFTVQGFTGGVFTAMKIYARTGALTKTIQGAVDTTHACGNFTSDESANVAMAFLNLHPEVTQMMDVLIMKKEVFRRGVLFGLVPLTTIVRGRLTTQQGLTAQLVQGVVQRLAADFANTAPSLRETIARDFIRALEAFA
ncbi:hypothetical protein ACJ73_10245 [Blastomyces percursus]|uniref:Uncharacterized protein n=1 Tax=Blastomyces percursus TaxID=1658174 RepID=A0A1J9NY39_9EURO|nr:hypothetical protein ACJ73_10245 [Blastomyces percursus]